MDLTDHQSGFHSEVFQMLIHRIKALPAFGAHVWHDYQPAVEQHSGIARFAARRTEFTDLGLQCIDQFRLTRAVDVVSYEGLQGMLVERTRNERAHGSGSSDPSVVAGNVLA